MFHQNFLNVRKNHQSLEKTRILSKIRIWFKYGDFQQINVSGIFFFIFFIVFYFFLFFFFIFFIVFYFFFIFFIFFIIFIFPFFIYLFFFHFCSILVSMFCFDFRQIIFSGKSWGRVNKLSNLWDFQIQNMLLLTKFKCWTWKYNILSCCFLLNFSELLSTLTFILGQQFYKKILIPFLQFFVKMSNPSRKRFVIFRVVTLFLLNPKCELPEIIPQRQMIT